VGFVERPVSSRDELTSADAIGVPRAARQPEVVMKASSWAIPVMESRAMRRRLGDAICGQLTSSGTI